MAVAVARHARAAYTPRVTSPKFRVAQVWQGDVLDERSFPDRTAPGVSTRALLLTPLLALAMPATVVLLWDTLGHALARIDRTLAPVTPFFSVLYSVAFLAAVALLTAVPVVWYARTRAFVTRPRAALALAATAPAVTIVYLYRFFAHAGRGAWTAALAELGLVALPFVALALWQRAVERARTAAGTTVTYGPAGATFTAYAPDPDAAATVVPLCLVAQHEGRALTLTLRSGMAGSVGVAGTEREIATILADASESSVSLAPGDWAVVHLDGEKEQTFFVQVAGPEEPLPRAKGDREELLVPALGFGLFAHGALLTLVLTLFGAAGGRTVFAGQDVLTSFLLRARVEAQPQPDKKPEQKRVETIDKVAKKQEARAKAGGEGQKRQRAPMDARQQARAAVRNKGLLPALRNTERFAAVVRRPMPQLRGYEGGDAGAGAGSGSGVGDDWNGTGSSTGTRGWEGGGNGEEGPIESVKTDAVKVKRTPGRAVTEVRVEVEVGEPDGDFGDLTPEQIRKTVASRARSYQACFEAQLSRDPKLAGTIKIAWRVDSQGAVAGAKIKSTTMANTAVESCLLRRIKELRFPPPANGGEAAITFPFTFASSAR